MVNSDIYTKEQLKELELSEEECEQLERVRTRPIVFDEECPPTTAEKAAKFRRVNLKRKITSAK